MQALDTAFPGNPLDEVGLGQADGLPDRLDKAGLLQGLGSLWVSPILRARQTIAPIEAATGLSATVDSGLREVLAADLEMNTDARSVACYVDTTRAWMAGRPACRIPGSPEDGHDTLQRFDEAIDRICEQAARAGDSAALLVSHGTALRLWTSLRAAAGGGEVLHHLQHLTDQLGVQGRGRLVEEHELGVHRQGPGDRHPLLLAAGELGGVVVEAIPQPHPLQ